MGYRDALEDGIELYGNQYKIPCEICGRKLIRTQYSRKRTYICDYCKGLIKKKEKILLSETLAQVETKAEKRFNKAIERIEKQVKNFHEYESAIRVAKTKAELYGSIPEAMVAIQLLKLKYKIIPQQKIGKYRVDFVIPDEKIVIEVDGSLYHKNIYKTDREAFIQMSLGLQWRIIHIPAELIEKNITKLQEAIDIYK